MLAEMGRAIYEATASPSWANPNDNLENLLDDQNRIDPLESDAEDCLSCHETESEQSGLDDEDPYENDDPSNCFLGRDKVTVWHANAPRQYRTSSKNIVIHLPGVKKVAKNAKSPIDCWKLFFSDSMIEKIVSYTNIYLQKARAHFTRERDCRSTDVAEIMALFGLLYLAGVKKAHHLNVKELWATDGTAPECFRATMSYNRFLLLLRALRFDNIEDRAERKTLDNLAPIREVLEEFNNKCKENYQVGEYSTIDEMLEPFRGKCKFRQYIPSKPAKYGIKIYALVDSRTFYTNNIEVYAGRQPNGPFYLDNSASAVVKRLAEHILNTGRNITMDNYFTSIPLAKELLEKKTTIVGTIRKNKREIPPNFVETKNKPLRSSLFGFTKDGVLVCYKAKPNKIVLLYSTMHSDGAIDAETGDLAKPELMTFYNMTKCGVDVVDEMKGTYSVSRVSCRWPLTIFFGLMNIGGINSQIVYKSNTEDLMDRRIFLKNLAIEMMKGHLVTRSTIQNIPLSDRKVMKRIAGVGDEEDVPRDGAAEGFCAYCPRRKNKKTKKSCSLCKIPVCPTHTIHLCLKCNENDAKHNSESE